MMILTLTALDLRLLIYYVVLEGVQLMKSAVYFISFPSSDFTLKTNKSNFGKILMVLTLTPLGLRLLICYVLLEGLS